MKRMVVLATALVLAATACGDTATTTTTTTTTTTAAPVAVGDYDPTLSRDDVDCSRSYLEGEDGEFAGTFVTAHYVVDGALGAVCLGEPDVTLLDAWELLTSITPPDELAALAILAGFDAGTAVAEETLAFVNVVGDEDGTEFQMSVNLPASEKSATEFALTVAHEFSHILAAGHDQLDRDTGPGACPTFFNGEGCAVTGSYLDEWVDRFWTEQELAEVDPDFDDPDAAEDRCILNPDFLGAYAATNPDEDFAESFAAFVFQVEIDTPGLQDKMAFFAERPELAEFRDRAEAAGLDGVPNRFDRCG